MSDTFPASSPLVPTVAPWQANFNRYPVQIYSLPLASANTLQIAVPSGKFWRVVYVSATFSASAAAASRVIEFDVTNPQNTNVLQARSSVAQTNSTFMQYLAYPSVSPYANTTSPGAEFSAFPIPDMVWQYGYTFQFVATQTQAGDTWLTPATIAVEIYTESAEGVLTPVAEPVPSPILA